MINKIIEMIETAIETKETMCTYLFPNLSANFPIGIATIKQIKLKIAKQIDEKLAPSVLAAA